MGNRKILVQKIGARHLVDSLVTGLFLDYAGLPHLDFDKPQVCPNLFSCFNVSSRPSPVFPVRCNASCFALRCFWPCAEAAVQPAPRSAGDRVLLAGCIRFGFGEAELGIVLFGIVCFVHGPCSSF